MSETQALDVNQAATPCRFCGAVATAVPIVVDYRTNTLDGPHDRHRVQCTCGAIGKCQETAELAFSSWAEWQALPPRPLHRETSAEMASLASYVLADKDATERELRLAASVLSQRAGADDKAAT